MEKKNNKISTICIDANMKWRTFLHFALLLTHSTFCLFTYFFRTGLWKDIGSSFDICLALEINPGPTEPRYALLLQTV